MRKRYLVVCLVLLLLVSSMLPMSFGNNLSIQSDKVILRNHGYIDYNGSVFSTVDQPIVNIQDNEPTLNCDNNIFSNVFVEGQWPMYCHDTRHTGRSPYGTAGNFGIEKWRFDTKDQCTGSPVIDEQGVIYVAGFDGLFAVYPNGTMKWHIWPSEVIVSAAAIDDNGVLYFGGIWEQDFHAVYSENGTEKWRYPIGDTYASPTVGPDGIIYAPATDNWNVIAFYPNGTVKWSFHANERVYSSPAIGSDGTVYCTSYGSYLYALYPENGTVKWQYHTGGSVRTSACIADDGTVYVVSVNGVLHALYPNGTLKWQQTSIDGGTPPTIGQDGTIYCGYHQLYAVNPDGSLKWVFNPGEGRSIREGTPCNSLEGIIYFGTYGNEVIAVNPDGTERWRVILTPYCWSISAPAIGSDGTVYVGSWNDGSLPYSWGYLHAIGTLDHNAPSAPVISGPKKCVYALKYTYSFKSTSPVGNDVYYNVDWGDLYPDYLVGPYKSGEQVNISNKRWNAFGRFTIHARAIDSQNLCGGWSEYEVSTPRNRASYSSLFLRFLERFPFLEKLFYNQNEIQIDTLNK